MTTRNFRLGLSGHDECVSCATLHDLVTAAQQLAPGKYWIEELLTVEGYPTLLALDWGTLEIRGPNDWQLSTIACPWGDHRVEVMRSDWIFDRLP